MKKIAILLLVFNFAFGQEITPSIGNIKIRSKVVLTYNSRDQKADTIYIAIKRWNYDQFNYNAEVVDYIAKDRKFIEINRKFKSFPTETVNYLFGQISPMISSELNYSDFLNALLTQGLLLDTQTNLIGDVTVYGGNPTDWEIAVEPIFPPLPEPVVEPTPDPIPE